MKRDPLISLKHKKDMASSWRMDSSSTSKKFHAFDNAQNKGLKRKRNDYEGPSCLNSKFREKGRRHLINMWKKRDEAKKIRLRVEYIAWKKWRFMKRGKIASLFTSAKGHHSALFSASFEKGKVSCYLLADQGADVNLLPERFFKSFIRFKK